MVQQSILFFGPVVAMLVFLLCWEFKGSASIRRGIASELVAMASTSTDDSCSCPHTFNCSVAGSALLGGIDLVQYFTDFKISSHEYNESNVGLVGKNHINSTYGDYHVFFLTQKNKDLFEKTPEKFLPQYGGFCSWGISAEFCPGYPWAEDCLGPPGNFGHWTIVNEKLYFFFLDEVKQEFLLNPSFYIEQGNARWASWFPESSYSFMNTNCYQPKNTTATSTNTSEVGEDEVGEDEDAGDAAIDLQKDAELTLQVEIEKDLRGVP